MRILFSLLLIAGSASAQPVLFSKDSAIIKEIELPSKEPFDTAKSYFKMKSDRVYIISDKDVYDLFGYKISTKFYQFNFADNHILGELKCRQCMMVCHHDEGETNCHRNACNKEWIWVMRDNKRAFTEIPSYTEPWFEKKTVIQEDTIISIADTSRWHTTGHGDCFAKFEYGLFFDKYHSALILKEWNYWGGCRAGGSKVCTIVFKEPEGILYKMKRTILMDRMKE
ncbi:MAG: hypothetical protein HOP10_08160 [Chitinophagaceae bacterium]|nr:hypothetical protein [Chitinophagaceae bacterium]